MKWLWILPPILFVLNFSFQVHEMLNRGVSSWIGGGYGMFANIDRPSNRLIHIETMEPDGLKKIEIKDPKVLKAINRYKYDMDQEALKLALSSSKSQIKLSIFKPEAKDEFRLKLIKVIDVI